MLIAHIICIFINHFKFLYTSTATHTHTHTHMHSIVCTAFAFYTNCSKQCLIINFCALLCAIADGNIRTTSLAEIEFNNKSEQCNAKKYRNTAKNSANKWLCF